MVPSILNYEYIENETEIEEILNKFFVNNIFRQGYVRVKGVTLPSSFKKYGDRIQRMDVKDDDIFLCSFPKTGTTWLSEMIWCIQHDLDFEGANQLIEERVPFLDVSSVYDYDTELMCKKWPDFSVPDYIADSVKYVEGSKSPRIIKTHLRLGLLPEKLRNFSTGAKIVYVWRNPKDTCVSYYHHCRLLEGYTGDFDSFSKLFLNDLVPFAPFWEHVLEFWALRNNPNVLFLKYEDMRKDLPSAIRKTVSFLGKSMSDEQIAKLKDHLSFENMKKNPAVNNEYKVERNKKYNIINAAGTFIRSGTVGGWRGMMTPEIIDEFDALSHEKLANSGLTLDLAK